MKSSKRTGSPKLEEEWEWEEAQMIEVGWEIWHNPNYRKFFKNSSGQLIRTKAVGKYLRTLGRIYHDHTSGLDECPQA